MMAGTRGSQVTLSFILLFGVVQAALAGTVPGASAVGAARRLIDCPKAVSAAAAVPGLRATVEEAAGAARTVTVKRNQLLVDGERQPMLYGAEFQYFRLRGGYGKNVPREEVLAAWDRGLEQMRKAGMNTVSFYIPWGFHEVEPGKFDFTGAHSSVPGGIPDYPARDVKTFIDMAVRKGFSRIMVRPGPYVNAEWGFLGFGDIPLWFHEKYPEAHMRDAAGRSTKLYDYHNPDLLKHTQQWFQALHDQVLAPYIGKDGPVVFLQIDNETNFMWQSIFNHDYGRGALTRFREFVRARYGSLDRLNEAYKTGYSDWMSVEPPRERGKNLALDQDWYRFQDQSMYEYLQKIRGMWEEIGVREPQVMFTVAESYNAAPGGILPNYRLRNMPGKTGALTVNMYPKTSEPNLPEGYAEYSHPAKPDHDMLAAASSNAGYFGGRRQEAVIGPEIHTGWWRGINVSDAARQQTYLTMIGRGMKALYFYYFHEGFNWQVEWAKQQIEPFFARLKAKAEYRDIATESLPDVFWEELQQSVDSEFMVGFHARGVLAEDTIAAEKLYFDAPLDAHANPTARFDVIERIGNKVVAPYRDFLSKAVSISDDVAILKDPDAQVPSPIAGVDSAVFQSDNGPGLVSNLMNAGLNPTVAFWGMTPKAELARNKVLVVEDNGVLNPQMVTHLANFVREGGTVVSYMGDSVARALGVSITGRSRGIVDGESVAWVDGSGAFKTHGTPSVAYDIPAEAAATPLLKSGAEVVAYEVPVGKGKLLQVGAVPYADMNSGRYGYLEDVASRTRMIQRAMSNARVTPRLQVTGDNDRVVAFGRRIPSGNKLWITAKSGRTTPTESAIKVDPSLFTVRGKPMDPGRRVVVRDLLADRVTETTVGRLTSDGFPVSLGPTGSAVYFLEPARSK